VKNLIDYQIPFSGLKEGIHHYDFKVDDTFFEHFEYSEIRKSDIKVDLELDRQSTLMVLDMHIHGSVGVECSRCLDDLLISLDITDKVVIKFGDEVADSRYIGEEVQVVSIRDHEINIAHYIYEFILLGLPVKMVHPQDEDGNSSCNSDMLDKLDGYSVHEDEESEETDPRWDKLKDLLNN
jgi:uncharacterized protein